MVTYANLVALIVAVLFGVLALSEPLPQSALGIAGRLFALCLLGAGSLLLMPGSMKTKSASHSTPGSHDRDMKTFSRTSGAAAGAGHGGMMDPVQVLAALDPKQV